MREAELRSKDIRILVVGDQAVCELLKTGTLDVNCVGDISDAIGLTEGYALLIVDAIAAARDATLFERLKQEAAARALQLFSLVPSGDPKARMDAFAAGAVDCISLDMSVEEMRARIAAHARSAKAYIRLQQENERYHLALSSIGQGVCLFDADEKLLLSNDRYAEVYDLDPALIRPGLSLEDILGLRYDVGTFPDMTRAEYLDWAKSTNIGVTPSSWVRELKRGKVIRGHHQRTADGGWVATHEDITEAWKSEKALAEAHIQAERAEQEARAAHARLLAAFEVVPEGLALFDAEDRYVLWNQRYEQLYVETGDKLTKGLRFEDRLRAGLTRGQYVEAIGREEEWLEERLARHAQPTSTHEQHLPGDRWLRIEERRIADGGSVGIRVDITDLKRREASFRLLFENNPMPMWVYDWQADHFLAVNRAAVEHYGFSREQFLSMGIADIHVPGDSDRVANPDAFEAKVASEAGWTHLRADGTTLDVTIYSSRLKYDGRETSLIAAVDITERARAEKELIEHRDMLEETVRCRTAELAQQAEELERMLERERQINELQRQFVSMASHEFRTPLAVIDGAAQRLSRRKEQLTSEFILEKTGHIRSSVSRMLDLMESILAAGRLDHGRIEIHRQPCSLKAVISHCAARHAEIRSTHRFRLNLEDLPETIAADPASIEQVINNLLSNAVKYSPGRPDVDVIGWTEGDHACIGVRDYGIGIDADDLPNMFQRYFRARSSSGIAGTGIGLNLVRQIVELHGGTIGVASTRGVGTTFTVRLPLADLSAGDAPVAVAAE